MPNAVSDKLLRKIVKLRKMATTCGEHARNERPPFETSHSIPRLRRCLEDLQTAVDDIADEVENENNQRLQKMVEDWQK